MALTEAEFVHWFCSVYEPVHLCCIFSTPESTLWNTYLHYMNRLPPVVPFEVRREIFLNVQCLVNFYYPRISVRDNANI